MGQTVHCGQYHSETVEQRHADTEFVILSESHVFTCEETVVRNTEVCKHNTLWKACGSTGVLHVTYIIAANLLLHLVECIVLHILSKQQQFGGVKHSAILLHSDINYVLQIWETLAVQMSALACLQLWQHGVGHVYIVTVPCTIGNAENLHVGVLTQILKLVLLVVGVYSHQNGTNLCCGIEEGEPVGHIGSPDTYV